MHSIIELKKLKGLLPKISTLAFDNVFIHIFVNSLVVQAMMHIMDDHIDFTSFSTIIFRH